MNPTAKVETLVKLPNFWWYGEGSGHTFDFLVEKVAPKIKGEVQAILMGEDGRVYEALAIKDGRVERCELVQTLKLPKDW